jgi:hypothetical protein
MARTIGELTAEARVLLNDVIPISGSPRFSDADLVTTLNDAIVQIRTKRPDAFLRFGLRRAVPAYALPADADTALPVDDMFYAPMLYYVVGRSELVEDTFSDDGRAISLMNKFVSQLLKVAS